MKTTPLHPHFGVEVLDLDLHHEERTLDSYCVTARDCDGLDLVRPATLDRPATQEPSLH